MHDPWNDMHMHDPYRSLPGERGATTGATCATEGDVEMDGEASARTGRDSGRGTGAGRRTPKGGDAEMKVKTGKKAGAYLWDNVGP